MWGIKDLIGQAPAIVLELEDAATALKVNTAANNTCAYAVSNVELRCKQIKFNALFNETFERTLSEAGSVGINYITETFLHAQNSIPSGTTGQYNVPFSVNPRSAKYILACGRLETDVAKKDAYSLSNRSSMGISDYSWEIAGRMYPSQPIKLSSENYTQAYANILDCFGQISAMNHSNLITVSTAATKFYDATQATAQKYISGLVLEQFNSSTNPSIYSGENLSTTGQLTFRPTLGTAAAAAYRVDFIISADMSIHFTMDGRMYSVK